MLPANAHALKCAHHNNHHDGSMNFSHRDEEVNYFPSRYDPCQHAEKYPIPSRVLIGKRRIGDVLLRMVGVGKKTNLKSGHFPQGQNKRALQSSNKEPLIIARHMHCEFMV